MPLEHLDFFSNRRYYWPEPTSTATLNDLNSSSVLPGAKLNYSLDRTQRHSFPSERGLVDCSITPQPSKKSPWLEKETKR
jgi:hypothetical protein